MPRKALCSVKMKVDIVIRACVSRMTVYSLLLSAALTATCSLVHVLFLLSFVSCSLDKKFPPWSLMSVPEKCAWPVSARVGWPLSVFDWAGGMSQSVASLSSYPLLAPVWSSPVSDALPTRSQLEVFSGVKFLVAVCAALTVWDSNDCCYPGFDTGIWFSSIQHSPEPRWGAKLFPWVF